MFTCASCGDLLAGAGVTLQGAGPKANLVNYDVTPEEPLTELTNSLQEPRPHQLRVVWIDTK